MPRAAPRPCPYPGCGVLGDGYCAVHKALQARRVDSRRASSTARGYGRTWQKARAAWLHKHPLCVVHERRGQVVAATDVDHVVPHGGDKALFWDSDNWQSLCHSCHSEKTAREDGGFGNAVARLSVTDC